MTRILVDELVRGSLGELYFKHYCRQHNHLYARVEDIASGFTPRERTIVFARGFERVHKTIPHEIESEVFAASRPTNSMPGSPSYVVDFLTCRDYDELNGALTEDYAWVEVKTGGSQLTPNQVEFARACKVRHCIFRIPNVYASPYRVQVRWELDQPMKQERVIVH